MSLPTARDRANYSRSATLDIRSAMALALVRKIDAAEFTAQDGTPLRFAEVFDNWPTYQDTYRAPGTACVLPGDMPLEASRLTPSLMEDTWEPAGMPGLALYQLAEVNTSFDIAIKCPSIAERQVFLAGLENMWNHDDLLLDDAGARYGVSLPLPEYWGVDAVFSLKSVRLQDDENSAMREQREAVITVTGQAPQVVLRRVQPMTLTVRMTDF